MTTEHIDHAIGAGVPTQGVFYVATGEKHRQASCDAIEFLRSTNPHLGITVFTDEPESFVSVHRLLDQVIALWSPRYSFIDKLYGFLHAPYVKNVFLDTDTLVAGDISDLFVLLDRVEFAAAHAPGHSGARMHPYESPELPAAFTQFNTGVVGFVKSERTHKVFERWRELYESNPQHRHDQPALREALFYSDISVYVLPPEYNFLVGHAYLSGPVKIFHSSIMRNSPREFINLINQHTGPRVFIPPDKVCRM
ncbi:MAG: hypothetical protein KF749_06505 [Bacteroidetes bacterium]|nr:hypothetical protein [Bacteroidota bacterium]MCW5896883.1 hypothetical protein [Bacteroidota bacterium]